MKPSTLTRDAVMNALAPLANSGFLRLYEGGIPASPDDKASAPHLAELRFGPVAFLASAGGELKANILTEENDAPASGTAGFFRVFMADGVTALWDGTIGTSASDDMTLNNAAIQKGSRVNILEFYCSLPQ